MTITIARFVPIVRTVAPFLAGLSDMRATRFFAYNIVGGILWCAGVVSAGFWLGKVELGARAPAMAVVARRGGVDGGVAGRPGWRQ